MTAGLRPYPDYKDSGLPWLGRVPAHWGTTGLGAISLRRSERNRPELPLLSVLREKGVVLRSSLAEEENHNFIPDDLSNYRVALAGDLVVNKMKAWQGSVGIAPTDGIVSPAYFVFELSGIAKEYAHRLLRCRLYADYFARASDGVRIGQWDLSIDQMKRIPIVIPPIEEQGQIVRYLDVMDRRIRRFIRNRRRLIEVLNEQKQAIINRAVTRGLDPNVPLKPSGIDWLGEIPRHWQTRRLKHLLSQPLKYGANAAAELADRSLPRYIRITDIDKDGQLIDERFRSISPELAEPYMLRDGDILLARSGATVGKAFLYTAEAGLAAHAGYLIKARVNRSRILPEFLYAVLQSARYWRWIASMTIQATIQNVNAEKYANLWVTVPSLSEQREILDAINRDAAVLSDLIHKAKREIDLIREYRTRLIADVVTGKLDVRHLSPAEIPADEITEEPAEGIDGEEPEVEEAELVEEAADADD